ncbi:MAG: dTDP-4-dehydrorhamnose 3,5-epimerase family protein [Acidobacteriota bacterium]
MIEGVIVTTLEPKADERGRLVELFRRDQPGTGSYGQVHLSTLYPGVVKAWHMHKKRTDSFVCVQGMVRMGLYDDREGSSSQSELNQFFLGDHSPLRVTVPPGVWFGFKSLVAVEALLVVLTDPAHDPRWPDEERWDPIINEIPFDWERRDR